MKQIIILVVLSISSQIFGQKHSIKVIVPEETVEVYVSGNQDALGDWNPKGLKMNKISEREWTVEVELTYPAEFKFTSGSWDSEGITQSLGSNPNLILQDESELARFEVKSWMDHILSDKLGLDYDVKFIDSKMLGDKRQIKVYLPKDYSEGKAYPVIYITDGSTSNFEVAKNYITSLSFEDYQIIPQCILVGIVHKERNEELFNTKSGTYFTEYIFDELIPFIDSNYSTSGFNAMIGHSNGAEYNHILLLKEDNPFRGFISLSTSFAGKGSRAMELSELFKSYNGENLYYFIANATYDSPERIEFGDEIEQLYKDQTNTQLHLVKKTYEADHLSVVPAALLDGLRHVFKDYRNKENYPSFNDYKNNYKADMKAIYGVEVEYSMTAVDGYLDDALNNKNPDVLEAYFAFIEEHKLWFNPYTGAPAGLDMANQANMSCLGGFNDKCIEKYNLAFEGLNTTVEPEVYYGNISRVIEVYLKQEDYEGGIAFLSKSISYLKEENNPYNNNRDWGLLKLNYILADMSLNHNTQLEDGKKALAFCQANYIKNSLFSQEDLKTLKQQ